MGFLVDEELPRLTGNLLQRHGHQAKDVRDIGLRGASDTEIAAYARTQRLTLVTADLGFADIRNYPPGEFSGIVVLRLPPKATSSTILSLLESLLVHKGIVSQLKGKPAIVEPGRIRIRKG